MIERESIYILGQDTRVIVVSEVEVPFSALRKGDQFKAFKVKVKPNGTRTGEPVRGPLEEIYFEALDQVELIPPEGRNASGFKVKATPLRDRPQVKLDFNTPSTHLLR